MFRKVWDTITGKPQWLRAAEELNRKFDAAETEFLKHADRSHKELWRDYATLKEDMFNMLPFEAINTMRDLARKVKGW